MQHNEEYHIRDEGRDGNEKLHVSSHGMMESVENSGAVPRMRNSTIRNFNARVA
ncbi:MAG TPA: hypothetical protein PK916_14890 [Bacteroidota bacterium]|nr:hypothetical protein [Bacteroidota bacterium]